MQHVQFPLQVVGQDVSGQLAFSHGKERKPWNLVVVFWGVSIFRKDPKKTWYRVKLEEVQILSGFHYGE